VLAGTTKVTPLGMLPELSVEGLAGDRVSDAPSYVAVIELFAGKFEPLIVTVSPTWPLVGLSVIDPVVTVVLWALSAPTQLLSTGVTEYFQLPAGTLVSVQLSDEVEPLIVVLQPAPGATALPPAAG
jgi:hypothetical protein